jgi:hypothetical protein
LFTNILIDSAILAEEQAFKVKRNPLSQVTIQGASENIEDTDEEMEGSSEIDSCSSPPGSVVSIDSIAENADFIALE